MDESQPARERTYALVTASPPLGAPLMVGILTGLFTMETLAASVPGLSRLGAMLAGLGIALATATAISFLQRRQTPDRVRIRGGVLELARGDRTVRKVSLAKLAEVSELATVTGQVLLVADDRQSVVIARAQLEKERDYDTIAAELVELVAQADPTGELGRAAARTGRLRETISQQPVRATPVLVAVLAFSSFASFAVVDAGGRPFPEEAAGALSVPLLLAGETFRLFSYVFLHASGAHLLVSAAGLLWMGSFLEKLVGWERVLLAFAGGVAGGAAGHVATMLPTPVVGATAGLFGLFGLLAAVALVGRGRLPRALLPRASFWVVTLLLGILLPFSIQGPSMVPVITWVSHLAGAIVGFLVGVAVVGGRDLPVNDAEREHFRGFAWVALAALGIGLVGGAAHPRRDHPDDDEIITRALETLPRGLATALLQNQVAYEMLSAPKAGADSFDHAERIARVAVEGSERRHAEILDTLAVARYRMGAADEAKDLLREALKVAGDERMKRFLERRLRDVDAGGELTPDDVGAN